MTRKPNEAVAYYRTSSATNVGDDKDSLARQRAAVAAYAKRTGLAVMAEFYDAAVSGADPIDQRPGFTALLQRIESNGVGTILVEDATRFARDLAVQLAGHDRLRSIGVELVPVNAPEHFREDTPTAILIRQVMGAISQFEKAQIVAKLRAARDRKRAATGRCEGRPPAPPETIQAARRLARKRGSRLPSYRDVATGLAAEGHTSNGHAYGAESVKLMLSDGQRQARARKATS